MCAPPRPRIGSAWVVSMAGSDSAGPDTTADSIGHERVEVPLPRLPVDVFYGEGEGLGRLLARAGVLG
jgi:hypothetical protein